MFIIPHKPSFSFTLPQQVKEDEIITWSCKHSPAWGQMIHLQRMCKEKERERPVDIRLKSCAVCCSATKTVMWAVLAFPRLINQRVQDQFSRGMLG